MKKKRLGTNFQVSNFPNKMAAGEVLQEEEWRQHWIWKGGPTTTRKKNPQHINFDSVLFLPNVELISFNRPLPQFLLLIRFTVQFVF